MKRNPLICTMTEGYIKYPVQLLGHDIYYECGNMAYVMAINPSNGNVYDLWVEKPLEPLQSYEESIVLKLQKDINQ
jgi:hypothetical protein